MIDSLNMYKPLVLIGTLAVCFAFSSGPACRDMGTASQPSVEPTPSPESPSPEPVTPPPAQPMEPLAPPVEPPAPDWVAIPGGTFSMGSEEGYMRERPVHEVTVAPFEMTRSEITVGQYMQCVNARACRRPGGLR